MSIGRVEYQTLDILKFSVVNALFLTKKTNSVNLMQKPILAFFSGTLVLAKPIEYLTKEH